MYFVTCVTMTKIRNRKLNSLVCALNDTCVETTYSMDSTRVQKFRNHFRRPSLFSILRCILMPRTFSVFPCLMTWRKQKSYPQINLETSNDTSAGRPPPFHLSKVIFNLRYRGKVSVGWIPLGYVHPSAGSHCLSVVAVGKKFSRICGEKDFCLDAFP